MEGRQRVMVVGLGVHGAGGNRYLVNKGVREEEAGKKLCSMSQGGQSTNYVQAQIGWSVLERY